MLSLARFFCLFSSNYHAPTHTSYTSCSCGPCASMHACSYTSALLTPLPFSMSCRLWWQRIPLRAHLACTRLTWELLQLTIASRRDKTNWYAVPHCLTGMTTLALAITRRQLLIWPIQHTQRASRRAGVPAHLKLITTMSAKILPLANRKRP